MGKFHSNKNNSLYNPNHTTRQNSYNDSSEEFNDRPKIKLVLKVPEEKDSSKKPKSKKKRKHYTASERESENEIEYQNLETSYYHQNNEHLSTSPLSCLYSPASPVFKESFKEPHKKKKKKKGKKEKSKKSKKEKAKKHKERCESPVVIPESYAPEIDPYTSPITSEDEYISAIQHPSRFTNKEARSTLDEKYYQYTSSESETFMSPPKRPKLLLRIPSTRPVSSPASSHFSNNNTNLDYLNEQFSSPVSSRHSDYFNPAVTNSFPQEEQIQANSPCNSEFSVVSICSPIDSHKPISPKNISSPIPAEVDSVSFYSTPNITSDLKNSELDEELDLVSVKSPKLSDVPKSPSPKNTSVNPSPSSSQVVSNSTEKPKRKRRPGFRLTLKKPVPQNKSAIDSSTAPFNLKRLPRDLKSVLLKLLEAACKRDKYKVFQSPVDPEEVPDYRKVIKEPMDFGTMRNKVEASKYRDLDAFLKDFKLVCDNAMTYNDSSTVYYKTANHILELGLSAAEKERPIIIPASPLESDVPLSPKKDEVVEVVESVQQPEIPIVPLASKVDSIGSEKPIKKRTLLFKKTKPAKQHPTDGSLDSQYFQPHVYLFPSLPKLEPNWVSRKVPPAHGSEITASFTDYGSSNSEKTSLEMTDADFLSWGDALGLNYGASIASFVSGLGKNVEKLAVSKLNELSIHSYHLVRETRKIMSKPSSKS